MHLYAGMNSSPVHIAIPCYDGRVFPRFDGATRFCFFDVDPHSGTNVLKEQAVCPEGSDVCDWLAQQEVEGVICSGIQREFQLKLDQLGIWLYWGISGPTSQAIKQWLKRQPPLTHAAKA